MHGSLTNIARLLRQLWGGEFNDVEDRNCCTADLCPVDLNTFAKPPPQINRCFNEAFPSGSSRA